MTGQETASDGGEVLTLQEIIRSRMDERGWSYADLAHRTGDELTRSRLQQLGTATRMKEWPDVASLKALARALELDETTVVLSTAKSLALEVNRRGPTLAHLLPTGTDRLTVGMRDAILTIIRAAVAETLAQEDDEESDVPAPHPRGAQVLEWEKSRETRRNARESTGE